MPVFGQGCVLFLQSEIANVQRHGWKPQEILAGLAAVLPRNVFLYVAKAPNLSRFGWRFVLQGGTQRNLAAVKAQVDFIRDNFKGQARQPDIVLHEHCGEAGAIGAGLEAIRLWRHGHQTTFIGLDAAERITFDTHVRRRHAVPLLQERVRPHVHRRVGGGAGRGGRPGGRRRRRASPTAASSSPGARRARPRTSRDMQDIKAAEDAVKKRTPNLVALAVARGVEAAPPGERGRPAAAEGLDGGARGRAGRAARSAASCAIGIPRVFNMYALAPFFTGYLESLGVDPKNIVFSDFTNNEMYRTGATRGAIDPCFPSKVALAHVHNLLFVKHKRAPLDCIFFPMIDVLPSRFFGTRASNACPTVALTPQTVRAAFTKDSDLFAEAGVAYLDGAPRHGGPAALPRARCSRCGTPLLGLSWEENERAIEAGHETLADYEKTVRAAARDALEALERENRLGILLLGRPYHHDPGLNHGIPEELQKLGYAVFSQSTLPLDDDLLDRLFGDEMRGGLISAPDGHLRRVEELARGQQQPEDLGGEVRGAPPEPGGGRAVELQVRPRRADLRDDRGDHREVRHAVLRLQGHRREQAGRRDQAAARDDRLLAEAGAGIAARAGAQAERIEKWLASYERRLRRELGAPPPDDRASTVIPLNPVP